nr:hypothetical protein [Candidatus Sigynarchaeum springense]MDO8117503.1 hypothetical protein [Candidatus Sigynarchaeota archaeon]
MTREFLVVGTRKKKMEKPNPDDLVTVAGQLLAENKMSGAFAYYKKAANLYLEKGSYFKVFEVFKIMSYLYKEMGKLGEMIQLVLDTARKLEDFKVFDVAARMYENAGTMSYDLADYENASAYYQNASDLYLSIYEEDKSEEMRKLSGILLIKSAEATYRIASKKDKSESLMLEGIFRICALAEKIPDLETRLIMSFNRALFTEARAAASNLAKSFKDANEKILITKEFNVELLSTNVKARILHYQAEYLFLEYLLSRKMDGEIKAAKKANLVIDLLFEALRLMRAIIMMEYDREDIDRYCFDGMLYSITNALIGAKPEPDGFLEGIRGDVIGVINQNIYYKIMITIIGLGLKQAKGALFGANLGKLERVKSSMMKLIYADAL